MNEDGVSGTDNGSPYSPYCRVGRKVFLRPMIKMESMVRALGN